MGVKIYVKIFVLKHIIPVTESSLKGLLYYFTITKNILKSQGF